MKAKSGDGHQCHNDEEQLLYKLKEGDMAAFTAIYHRYFQKLYVYCLRITKSKDEAEDIVQDVFAKLWVMRGQIRAEATVKGLLFTIARNDIFKAYRRIVNAPLFVDYMGYSEVLESNHTVMLEYVEFERRLREVVEQLPKSKRRIFSMSRFENYSNSEIAQLLGINEQSVKNAISQTLKIIRAKLSEHLPIAIALMTANIF